jgi:hypothetical protein
VAGIRSLPGRQWDPTAKVWSLPATEKAVKAVRELAKHFQWRVAPDVPGGAPPPSPRPTLDAARAAKGQADASAAKGAFKGNTVPGPEGSVSGEWRTVKGKHLFFPDKGEVGGDVPEGPWGGAPWRPGWTGKGGRFRGANPDRRPNKRQMRLPGLESRLEAGRPLSARLAALLREGTAAPLKVQRPRPVDPYTRHAVVAIVAGQRQKRAPRRTDAPKAHDIARAAATFRHGPKVPYFKRTRPHAQTPRGRKYIQKHQKDRGHAAKDAKYYKLVGKRRAEFEGPWRLKGESLSVQLRALLEDKPIAMTPALAAQIEKGAAARAAQPRWRVAVGGVTSAEARYLARAARWPAGAQWAPWAAAQGRVGAFTVTVGAETAAAAAGAVQDAVRAAYEDQARNGVKTPLGRATYRATPAG